MEYPLNWKELFNPVLYWTYHLWSNISSTNRWLRVQHCRMDKYVHFLLKSKWSFPQLSENGWNNKEHDVESQEKWPLFPIRLRNLLTALIKLECMWYLHESAHLLPSIRCLDCQNIESKRNHNCNKNTCSSSWLVILFQDGFMQKMQNL
jgi:hypothetical protein